MKTDLFQDVKYVIMYTLCLYMSLHYNVLLQCFLMNATQMTRSHGSVRVFKDDRQSQWGMAKFDPQPTLNP